MESLVTILILYILLKLYLTSLTLWSLMKDVRLSGNPIDDPAKGGVPRFALIARLGKIKILNGSEVLSIFCRTADILSSYFVLITVYAFLFSIMQVTSRERRESEIRWAGFSSLYVTLVIFGLLSVWPLNILV